MREPTAPSYYDRRAPEYDDWYLGAGLYADADARMLEIASRRVPDGTFVQGDGLALPFAERSFGRVFAGHFDGHLDASQREVFLRETRRVATELVVVDASREHSEVDEQWSQRVLLDGSSWEVYKRYFTPDALLDELGGGEVMHAGHWFVAVRSQR